MHFLQSFTVAAVYASLLVAIALFYRLAISVRDLLFHPLSDLPGPKLWIAFPFLRHISACTGKYDADIRSFHLKYGSVVRYGPQEVSFTTAQAWKDIYGHGHTQLPKAILSEPGRVPDILNANDAYHTRYRKALSHGFSEKALRQQEHLVKSYVDTLITKLQGLATTGAAVDMVKWFNLTTFDIIGDLSFGRSFGGLDSSDYHNWVLTLFLSLKLIPFLQAAQAYSPVMKALNAFMPHGMKEQRDNHQQFAREVVTERIGRTDLHDRGDFMDSMLKSRGTPEGMTDEEIVANANVLIIAGSETTATLLSGCTFWMCRTPGVLARATTEVRSAFKNKDEITFLSISARLPYLLACLQEALRVYPPVPTNIPRRCLPDRLTSVDGLQLPGGTVVSVHHSSAYLSEANFHRANEFLPERWLESSYTDKNSPFYADKRSALQPFSVGPRNCIGQNLAHSEMRLILTHLLWSFDLELCNDSRNWNDQKSYVLWEKPALSCRLVNRLVTDGESRKKQSGQA